MDDFDILDEGFQESEISQTIISESGKIAIWVKIVAITTIASSVLTLLAAFFSNANIIGSVISTGITLGLYLTLLTYGNKLSALSQSGKNSDFTAAMIANKSYWVFLGVLMIIVIGLALLAFLFLGGALLNGYY